MLNSTILGLGLIVSILSMLLDFLFFFKITNLSLGGWKNFLYLLLVVIIGLCTNNWGYKGDVVYNLTVVLALYLIYRTKINTYLILNSIIFVFNIEIVLDIVRSIFLGIIRYDLSKEALMMLNSVLAFISCFLIVFVMNKYSLQIRQHLIGNNKRITLWLNCYLYLVTIIISIVYTESTHIPPVSIFFISFLILQALFAIGIYNLMLIEQKQIIQKRKQEEFIKNQHQLEEYTTYLEKSEDDLRAFRHDYKNILNSLKVSAQEGNVQEVIQKLDKYTETNLNSKALLKYKDVNHIYVKSVKSIIISKLTELYNLDIPYNFECRNNIRNLPDHVDELDLVRIIGITFDNAIEESKALIAEKHDIRSAEVQIMVYSDGPGEFEYEIRNKIENRKISTQEIQQRGFTTKKDHKGLGLTNIKEIDSKYPDMSISYTVRDGWFDFYMTIDTEDGEEDE
ncbi:MAG: GHKL domain-containing protein [Lactobacillus amylovorus]|uniref:GHKL domain-containing protein n=2 Tax=Lactobacillus amylovorus TaxID=1604 RepID=UPI001F0FD4AB|nr:GHKL domain-containing protein [Lactobacillus amylovorus]MDB6221095.1 GHKL domain-containing protein [Lactobacillus amylovorus]MDB6236416.1 GHKL domain-containing protein [Lactobacillus amylovorus]MDF9461373.1 GHKL domain-containing protein [Lactobacillus amylovorus]